MPAFVASFSGTPLSTKHKTHKIVCAQMQAAPAAPTSTVMPKVTLFSTPISNYSARVRYMIHRKEISEDEVEIRSPADLGGLKTDDYLKVNPLGRIPAAILHGTEGGNEQFLYESAVICEYVAEVFDDRKPSFIPSTAEERARARLIAHLLAEQVGPYHPYMYKAGLENRDSAVQKMHKGFDAIEKVLDEKGPYAVGNCLSIADCCLWGNWAFYDFMLPTFFGWHPRDGRPKLTAWENHMRQESVSSREVYKEVFEALQGWWDNGRWTSLSMTALKPGRPEMPF